MVDDLSFNWVSFGWIPTTPEHHVESSPHRYRSHNITCHWLVFTSLDDESPVRSSECCCQCSSSDERGWEPREADVSSSIHHNLCHHITPTSDQFLTKAWDADTTSFEEHFPTAPLHDDVWAEEQILDRCLGIHKRPEELNHQCSNPFPCDSTTFSTDLLQSIPQNEAVFNYNQMDLSDISSDLPDIMMTMSDAGIPDLADVSDAVWLV